MQFVDLISKMVNTFDIHFEVTLDLDSLKTKDDFTFVVSTIKALGIEVVQEEPRRGKLICKGTMDQMYRAMTHSKVKDAKKIKYVEKMTLSGNDVFFDDSDKG